MKMEDYSLNCFAIAGLNPGDTFHTRSTLYLWLVLLTLMGLLTPGDRSEGQTVYRAEFKLWHFNKKKKDIISRSS